MGKRLRSHDSRMGPRRVRVVYGWRGVPIQTIDEGSSGLGKGAAVPMILLLATAGQPMALVLPPPAELGRRIVAGGEAHEVGDERMSRDHAAVAWEDGAWTIRDLDSRNGTFVDGERISGEVRRTGDVLLRLGHTLFALLADGRGHPAPEGEHVVGPELARVHDRIRSLSGGDTLLIYGEPGSGKDLAARLYHEAGPRRAGPLVAVNCATIPVGVADRLLFGAQKGAIEVFGHFQMASGGTVFLDEISELDPGAQDRLLRAVRTREVVPVGATSGTPLGLGIVAATHDESATEAGQRRLREDLHEHLARASVYLPPLRERRVDLARLVQREIASVGRTLVPHAKLVETCWLRPWPGNIRELRAAIRRAATTARAAGRDVVRADDLGATDGMPSGTPTSETAVERPLPPAELGRDEVTDALARANGVVSVAARILGVHRTQLHRLMVKYGLARDDG